MNWPDTKDGKLFNRLARQGVNFNKPHYIEFNVDFDHWPPPIAAINELQSRFGTIKVFEPSCQDNAQAGYIALKTFTTVTYEFVMDTQQEITDCVSRYGGYCNSWAILL
jgi:hypothetical protein